MSSPASVIGHRGNRRQQVFEFFERRQNQRFLSTWLHATFGTGVKTRISELNRSQDCPITIRNEMSITPDGHEVSVYYAIPRQTPETLFDIGPGSRYPD